MKQSRGQSFLFTVVIYLLALGVGLYAFSLASGNVFVRVLIADLAATLFVYLVSLLLGNASVYDP